MCWSLLFPSLCLEKYIYIRCGSGKINIRDFPVLQQPDFCGDISGKLQKELLEIRVRSCGTDYDSAPKTRWLMQTF